MGFFATMKNGYATYIRRNVPTGFGARDEAYQRSNAPPPVWFAGRGAYLVQRTLNTENPAQFVLGQGAQIQAINAVPIYNQTPGLAPLSQRQSNTAGGQS